MRAARVASDGADESDASGRAHVRPPEDCVDVRTIPRAAIPLGLGIREGKRASERAKQRSSETGGPEADMAGLLSGQELAEKLGVSGGTVSSYVKLGMPVAGHTEGGWPRFREAECRKWKAGRPGRGGSRSKGVRGGDRPAARPSAAPALGDGPPPAAAPGWHERALAETIAGPGDWFEWQDPPEDAAAIVKSWAEEGLPVMSYRAAGGAFVVCHKDVVP